jgi:hypothetical protein
MLNYFFKNSNTLFLTCALAFISIANAQEVRVIDNKGTLKIANNNQVTTSTTAPTEPLEGDIWVNTDLADNNLYVWDGSSWIYVTKPRSSATYSIGDVVNGGAVFWVDSTGQHGLVAAFSDAAIWTNGVDWGCYDTDLPNVSNVTAFNGGNPAGEGAEIGDGFNNTNDILTDCDTAPAALAARSLGAQWFLPSAKELNQMYINKTTLEAVPGFIAFSTNGNHWYWSSSEIGTANAWRQRFSDGTQNAYFKNQSIATGQIKCNVRAVRAVRVFRTF